MGNVSLIKSKNSYQGTLKVLEPFKENLAKKIKNLEQIVIKINFVTIHNELATTPLDTTKAFIDFIKPFYKGKIIIAEEPTFGTALEGFKKHGFKALADKDPQVELFDSGKDKSEKIRFGLLTFPLAKLYTKPAFVVSICRAKTHDAVVVTLSIKNLLVGAIQHKWSKNRFKIHLGKKIHKIMTKIAEQTFPSLAIIDGVVGMQGNGPADGVKKKAGWIISSFDALAADSLTTFLMGFDINDVGYLNLLHQKGYGKLYPKDKIEIIGENPKNLITPFKPHRTFEMQRMWK